MNSIRNFEPRLYQQTIFNTCINHNTLVVLPTGLGKTNVILMVAAYRLKQYPESKIIILAPTKPLLDQHFDTFNHHLDIENIFPENKEALQVFSGLITPEKRQGLWTQARIIFSTPQGFQNDLISGKINFKDVSLLAFDEAHRATGDYAYNFIAQKYMDQASHPRIVGLTASPGSSIEKITEVCTNIFIEELEVKTDEDPDVARYIQKKEIQEIKVKLPEQFDKIVFFLKEFIKEKTEEIKKLGLLERNDFSKKQWLGLQHEIRQRLNTGENSFEILKGISLIAEIIKIQHAIQLIESQGITPFTDYCNNLKTESVSSKVKAVKNIVEHTNFKSGSYLADQLRERGIEHPKFEVLKDIIKKIKSDEKIIIFTQYRDTGSKILSTLTEMKIEAKLFVGQAKRKTTGLSQKQQKEILDAFRLGDFPVLIATSVAEEGLDIPSVDTVIFYEAVPSAIRSIQRKGRTGRHSTGKVILLITQGSHDESYKWASHHKEKRMYKLLKDLKSRMKFKQSSAESTESKKLTSFLEPQTIIIADARERHSKALKELSNTTKIRIEQLEVGDYLLSSRVVVEFKTQEDFLESLLDKRIFNQAKNIAAHYEKPLIIVEGDQDLYALRNIHENAIRGLLTSLIIDFNVPILFTKNSIETAKLLNTIATREQSGDKSNFSLHSRKPMSKKEQAEYVVASFPGIGTLLNKELLKEFKTIKNIVLATPNQLKKIEQIGDKKADELINLFNEEFKS